MEKENIKKLFKDFNWKLPEKGEEEWRNKYHFQDILRVIEEVEQQINLSLGDVSVSLPSFKEIKKAANELETSSYHWERDYISEKTGFIKGAQWLRDLLKKQ